jgi:hypothetical protein
MNWRRSDHTLDENPELGLEGRYYQQTGERKAKITIIRRRAERSIGAYFSGLNKILCDGCPRLADDIGRPWAGFWNLVEVLGWRFGAGKDSRPTGINLNDWRHRRSR